jgi:1-phosphatidylinositol phosphodiesterase
MSRRSEKKTEKKKVGAGRIVLRILGALLALILLALLTLYVIPLMETGDQTPVEGSADWMAALEDSTPLSAIVIPGTHDSATRNVQFAIFGKCQAKDIAGQLEAGFRYLDIRLALNGDSLKLVHGFANCRTGPMPWSEVLSLDAVLEDCYAFLDAHPTETILFVVKQEKKEEPTDQIQGILSDTISKDPERWLLTDTIPTLGEARGRLVLLRRYEDEAGLGKEAGIYIGWAEQRGHKVLTDHAAREDKDGFTLWVQDRFEYPVEEKWTAFTTAMKEAQTGDGSVAIHFLSTKGTATYGHPYGFARELNPKLMELEDLSGWIVVDFASAPLAEHIYQANFR